MKNERLLYLKNTVLAIFVVLNIFQFTGCRRLTLEKTEYEAKQYMKEIRTAEESFFKSFGRYANIEELQEKKLLFPPKYDFSKTGYQFRSNATNNTFEVFGVATKSIDETFALSLYLDESGVIRGKNNHGKPAGKTDEAWIETP
jgi:hypothetical protein